MLEPAWCSSAGRVGKGGGEWKRGIVWEMVTTVDLF